MSSMVTASTKQVALCQAPSLYQFMFADRVLALYSAMHASDDDPATKTDDVGTLATSATLSAFNFGKKPPVFITIDGLLFDLSFDKNGRASALRVLRETQLSYTVFRVLEFGRVEKLMEKRGLSVSITDYTEQAAPSNKAPRVVFVETGKGGKQRFETFGSDA